MSDSREKTMRLTRIALLIAMNCISAYLIIPLPFSQSPIALQTLVVNLVAFLLPPKDAAITMLAYIGIGIIGVPAVFLMSWFKGKQYSFRRYALVAVAIGIPVIYLGGVLQLKGITGVPWEAAVMSGVVPFIPLDIVKSLCAAALARPLLALGLKGTQD